MRKKLLTLGLFSLSASMVNAQFCEDVGPTSTSDTNTEAVELAGESTTITFTDGCPAVTGLNDQTALAADLVAGTEYTVDVTWGTCGGDYSNVGTVWIDYSGNEVFEPAEVIGTVSYGGGTNLQSYTFTVPADALNGERRMRVMQRESGSLPLDPCGTYSWGSVIDFTINISGGVDCVPPSGTVLDEVTTTTATLSWDAGAGTWQYDLGETGFDAGSEDPTITEVFPTTGVIADLTPNTTYDFYVRAICGEGDTSSWVGPFTFTTPCEAVSGDDFCEGFEPASETESCWTVLNENGDADAWNTNYTSNPHTGVQSAILYTDFNSGNNDDWLISPQLTLSGPKFLSFWYRVQSSGEPNDFEVLLSTTGNAPADFTDTLMYLASYNNTTYMDTLVDLADFAGEDVYIAFHVPSGGLDGWRLYIDDVCITTCPALEELTLGDVTTTTADLSWTAGSDETEWVVDFGEPGFTPGEGAPFGVDATSTTLTDLTPDTDYDVYVRTICTGGDSTLWVGPISFHTDCEAISVPFCEGFEPESETEGCWVVLNENGDADAWNIDYTSNPHTGAQSAVLYTDFNSGNNDDWLISPNMTLTGNEVMNFWYRVQSSGEPNDFEVLLSTTGNNPADFTDTLMYLASYNNTTYLDSTVDLSAYTGDVFIAFHVPSGGLDGWRLYLDDICFNVCNPAEGTDGSADVCLADGSVDLSSVITPGEDFGTWEYPANPLLLDGSNFDYSGLAVGTYTMDYVVVGGCSTDTTVATINVFGAPSAGEGSTINVCKNQPFDLLSGLSGTVDLGGTWTDPSGDDLAISAVNGIADAGTYTYTYAASNGVCPDETTTVEVVVGNCDYLSVDELGIETIAVFPNPTTGLLNIQSNGTEAFNFDVVDVTGRVVVRNNNVNGTVKVDLASQQAGIYMVRVYNDTTEKTIRVVLK